jgi:hypothetical protein
MKREWRWPRRGLVLLATTALLSVLAWAVAHGAVGMGAPPWPVAGILGWPLVLAL